MESSSGVSKRSRVSGIGAQVPSCLVDGCTSDLSKCRDYHRRHKVCEYHSKTPKVFIKGQERRFCQQCSRFHSVAEFDEGKRSCRKRLEGHNQRRRKPQPNPRLISSATLFSNHHGSRHLEFGSSHIFSASALSSATLGSFKSENHMVYDNQSSLNSSNEKNSLLESLSNSYNEDRQLPFSVTSLMFRAGDSNCEPSIAGSSTSESNGSGQKVFSDGLNLVIDSNRALSLLSSERANTQEIGVNRMIQPDVKPPDRSSVERLNYDIGLGKAREPTGSVLVSGGRSGNDTTNLEGQDMFHTEPHGSYKSGFHNLLSFPWQ